MPKVTHFRTRHPDRNPGACPPAATREQAIQQYAQEFASWGMTPAQLRQAQLDCAVMGLDTTIMGELADAMIAAGLTGSAQPAPF